jgi:putative Ca2+/H+ antiporter (TMEM165/GDT1 family)
MPEEIRVFLSTFALLFVAELGDKTQLAVISMTAKHKMPIWIFAGATLALAAVTLLGVVGGELLTRIIPEMVLRKIAAVLFMVMGVLMWFEKL